MQVFFQVDIWHLDSVEQLHKSHVSQLQDVSLIKLATEQKQNCDSCMLFHLCQLDRPM